MSRFQRHVFVCVNDRSHCRATPRAGDPAEDRDSALAIGRPSCGTRKSAAVVAALERAIMVHPDLCGSVAVTACGCLGPCFDGPNLVVYPEGVWYAGVTEEDVTDIVTSHLLGDTPVARLLYDWPDD